MPGNDALDLRNAPNRPNGGGDDLSVVLRRLGSELERLRALSWDTERGMGDAGLGRMADGDLARLQGLDTLTQHLGALAGICDGLASRLPEAVRVDIGQVCAGIGLQDLEDRLTGRENQPPAPGGAVELF